MVWAFTIVNRVPLLPGNKRKADASPLYQIWGTYSNTGASTGGAILTQGTKVLFASAVDGVASSAIRVQANVAADGEITITTPTLAVGEWFAVIRDKK